MKARNPRKAKAGDVASKFDKLGNIQRQIARERGRHNNKLGSIAAQRDALCGVADPALQAAKLAKLRYDEIEENHRYRDKISELERRAREVWK